MATSVAEQLVEDLRDTGVQRIYGLVGDSLNPIVDAVRRTEGIEWVHVHNEEAAAFAAAAEARLTGRLAVCAGSCGPGSIHLIQGLPTGRARHRSNALSVPPKITAEEVGSFALAGGKVILNGGVGRMIEMARSNLRNIPRP